MDFGYWFGNRTEVEAPPNVSWTAPWEVYWFLLDDRIARLAVLALRDQYFARPGAVAVFFVDHPLFLVPIGLYPRHTEGDFMFLLACALYWSRRDLF